MTSSLAITLFADPQIVMVTSDPIVPGSKLELAAPVTGGLLLSSSIATSFNKDSQTGAFIGIGSIHLT